MSVLINMEMPEKQTILTIFPNGYVAIYDAKDSFIGETKAFPVPKHGRLIDADVLYRKIKAECNPYGKPSIGYDDGLKVLGIIGSTPPVIPAEEGE